MENMRVFLLYVKSVVCYIFILAVENFAFVGLSLNLSHENHVLQI